MSETKKTKGKRVNLSKDELREGLEAKAMMEKEKAFWDEIRAVEDKHGRRIRAFLHPNIVEGIRPVISSTILEKVTIGETKEEAPVETKGEPVV